MKLSEEMKNKTLLSFELFPTKDREGTAESAGYHRPPDEI